jgi:hypothetical protein
MDLLNGKIDFQIAYTSLKEECFLAYLWTVTVGFLICLGLICGGFIFFLRTALNPEDATIIDSPIKNNQN